MEPTAGSATADVRRRPVLDLARGVVAGFSIEPREGAAVGVRELPAVLNSVAELPTNTYLSIPLAWDDLAEAPMRAALLRPASLARIIVELVGVRPSWAHTLTEDVVDEIRRAGGLIALRSGEMWEPNFTAVSRLRPALVLIDREWIAQIEASPTKRRIVQAIGRICSDVDAWVQATDVRSPAELAALMDLQVPLADGPVVGEAQPGWPPLAAAALSALRPIRPVPLGLLRSLLSPAPTAESDEAAARRADSDSSDAADGPDQARFVVVVDPYDRPTALVARPGNGPSQLHEVTRVNVDTPIGDAARRAAHRSEQTRSDPIAVTDDAGRFLGLVEMNQLTRYAYDLAGLVAADPATTWSTIVDELPGLG